MFGLQAKLILAAVVVAIIGGLLWRDKIVTKQRNEARAEARQLTATLASERANRKTEQDDRRKADESAKSLMAELDRIRNAPQPVSVWCRPNRVSPAPSESGTTPGPNDASAGSGPEEPLQDIGAAVAAVWREHQSNAAVQLALQKWERERTH